MREELHHAGLIVLSAALLGEDLDAGPFGRLGLLAAALGVELLADLGPGSLEKVVDRTHGVGAIARAHQVFGGSGFFAFKEKGFAARLKRAAAAAGAQVTHKKNPPVKQRPAPRCVFLGRNRCVIYRKGFRAAMQK